MRNAKNNACTILVFCSLGLAISCFSGCASKSRVSYQGSHLAKVKSAVLVTDTPIMLRDAGFKQIGTITSEPTTHGITVSKEAFEKDPHAVYDSIAPENCEQFRDYYASLDKEVCRQAANAGGQKVRLEEIVREYPEFRDDIAALMEKTMAEGITMKTVVSTKVWSVWKKQSE